MSGMVQDCLFACEVHICITSIEKYYPKQPEHPSPHSLLQILGVAHRKGSQIPGTAITAGFCMLEHLKEHFQKASVFLILHAVHALRPEGLQVDALN